MGAKGPGSSVSTRHSQPSPLDRTHFLSRVQPPPSAWAALDQLEGVGNPSLLLPLSTKPLPGQSALPTHVEEKAAPGPGEAACASSHMSVMAGRPGVGVPCPRGRLLEGIWELEQLPTGTSPAQLMGNPGKMWRSPGPVSGQQTGNEVQEGWATQLGGCRHPAQGSSSAGPPAGTAFLICIIG